MESPVKLGDDDMLWSTFIQSVCLSVCEFSCGSWKRKKATDGVRNGHDPPFVLPTPLGLRKCSYFPAPHVWLTRLCSLVTGCWGRCIRNGRELSSGVRGRAYPIRKEQREVFSFPVIRLSGPLPGLNQLMEAARIASLLFLISTNAVKAVFLAWPKGIVINMVRETDGEFKAGKCAPDPGVTGEGEPRRQ